MSIVNLDWLMVAAGIALYIYNITINLQSRTNTNNIITNNIYIQDFDIRSCFIFKKKKVALLLYVTSVYLKRFRP